MKEKIVIATPVSQIDRAITSLGLSEYLSDGTINDNLLQRQVRHPTKWRAELSALLSDGVWNRLTGNPKYCGKANGRKTYIMPVGSLLHIVTQCISESGLKDTDKKQRLLSSGKRFMECLTSDRGVVLDDTQSVEVTYTLNGKPTDLTPCTYKRVDYTRAAPLAVTRSDTEEVACNDADDVVMHSTEKNSEGERDASQSPSPMLTITEAAHLACRSRRTIERAVESGSLDSLNDIVEGRQTRLVYRADIIERYWPRQISDLEDIQDDKAPDQCLNLRDAGYVVGCEPEALRSRSRRGTLKIFRSGQGRRAYVMKSDLIQAFPDKKMDIIEFEPIGSPISRKRVEEQNELKRSADMRKIRVDTENAIHDVYNDMLSAMGTRMRSVRWEVAIVGALAIISIALQLSTLFNGMQK